MVVLDGSESLDARCGELSYYWFYGEELLGEGERIEAILGLGRHEISLIVNNGIADSLPDEVVITVTDNTPPQVSLTMDPSVLWPVNKMMVEVVPIFELKDNCSEVFETELVSVVSSQNGENDIELDNEMISLLADRDGNDEDGRVYTVTYKVTDESGNETVVSAEVKVPHDMGEPKTATY